MNIETWTYRFLFTFVEKPDRLLVNRFQDGLEPQLWNIRKNKQLEYKAPELDVRLSQSRYKLVQRITRLNCITDSTGIWLYDHHCDKQIIRFPNTMSDNISQVALSPSHRYLVYVLRSGDIRIWDLKATGEAIKALEFDWID